MSFADQAAYTAIFISSAETAANPAFLTHARLRILKCTGGQPKLKSPRAPATHLSTLGRSFHRHKPFMSGTSTVASSAEKSGDNHKCEAYAGINEPSSKTSVVDRVYVEGAEKGSPPSHPPHVVEAPLHGVPCSGRTSNQLNETPCTDRLVSA